MFDSSYLKAEVRTFQGAWTSREETDVPPSRAVLACNVEYDEGRVLTRRGFGLAFPASGYSTGHFNWVYADPSLGDSNYLLWWSNGALKYANLNNGFVGTAYSQIGGVYSSTFAVAGTRVYISHFDGGGMGIGHGRVFSLTGTDTLFAPPLTTSQITISQSASLGGNLTPGTRRLAVVLGTRNGYTGKPGPVDGSGNLVAASVVVATGATNKTVTITVTPSGAWSAYAKNLYLLATTTTNQARYFFVPGATTSITPGSSTAATFTLNLSDDALNANAEEATKQFDLLTQNSVGDAPISPTAIIEYGNRLGYVVNNTALGSCMLFSDEGNFQAVSAARSVVYTPGQRQIVTAFVLGSVCYILGPSWTYAVQDSGADPVSWAGARDVDRSIGTIAIRGVAVNVSQGLAWVASPSGLYRFQGGSYDRIPVSQRNQPEWDRINWAVSSTLEVVDDAQNKRVHVKCALDANTGPSHILTFDYSNGTGADGVNFSLDYLGGGYLMGSIGMVTNVTSKRSELWVGPQDALAVWVRQMYSHDPIPYRDLAAGIDSQYETGPMMGGHGAEQLSQHHGALFRIRGAGTASVTAYTTDRARTYNLSDIAMSASPGKPIRRAFDCIAEDVRYKVTNKGVADSYFELSNITHYHNPYAIQR